MNMPRRSGVSFGWRVVSAAFVLAVLGWGIGFYGPPAYLQAIHEQRGWSAGLIVIGAIVVADLPRLYAHFGVPIVTKAGAIFVSPWFVRTRPAALSMAYNGASIRGILFSPLWVGGISILGFRQTAAAVGVVTAFTIWALADRLFSRIPQQMGLRPDGDTGLTSVPSVGPQSALSQPGSLLRADLKFLTLAAGMALGLFAQIG